MSYYVPSRQSLYESTESGDHKFEVVSLFAGGGGSSTGYRMAGGKVLLVNEFIPEAASTYKANWPTTLVIEKDIRETTGLEILNLINKGVGELDLLDGSPPCSAFSTAGSRDKGWGKVKKYSDSSQKNVEDLFFDYARMVREIQPRVFIAENVSGLVMGTAKGYFNQIMRELKACGYHVECQLLNSKWLGVPQTRVRTIFIGVREDLYNSSLKGKLYPKPFSPMITLREAFEGLDLTDQDRLDTNIPKTASIYEKLRALKPGETSKSPFNLKKAHPDKPSGTIMATDKHPLSAGVRHWHNRGFSIREIKRIMSVPDDYILTGSYAKQVERLGRMVAPLMMKAVAENILALGLIGNGDTRRR